jgi:hypothetical protein
VEGEIWVLGIYEIRDTIYEALGKIQPKSTYSIVIGRLEFDQNLRKSGLFSSKTCQMHASLQKIKKPQKNSEALSGS